MDMFIRDEEGRVLANVADQRLPELPERPQGPWDRNFDNRKEVAHGEKAQQEKTDDQES